MCQDNVRHLPIRPENQCAQNRAVIPVLGLEATHAGKKDIAIHMVTALNVMTDI